MPRSNQISYIAGGTIGCAVFVKQSTAADETVLLAGSGDTPIGISQEGQRLPPGVTGSDTTIAALAGQTLCVYQEDDDCMLQSATGWTHGDYLKPDASGFGVTASSTNVVGAKALTTVASGGKGRVKILPPGSKMP